MSLGEVPSPFDFIKEPFPLLPPNAYRTHLPLPPEPVSAPISLDPSTVRAIAEQVRELLEKIVRESPDHPCP